MSGGLGRRVEKLEEERSLSPEDFERLQLLNEFLVHTFLHFMRYALSRSVKWVPIEPQIDESGKVDVVSPTYDDEFFFYTMRDLAGLIDLLVQDPRVRLEAVDSAKICLELRAQQHVDDLLSLESKARWNFMTTVKRHGTGYENIDRIDDLFSVTRGTMKPRDGAP